MEVVSMMKRWTDPVILGAVFLLVLAHVVFGAGEGGEGLDPDFGMDGRLDVTLGGYGDQAHAVLIQSDGRILVGGSSSSAADLDFSLLRFEPDGTPDRSFNYDGSVVTPVGRGDDEILALGLLADGRIIAAGYSSNGTDRDFALACYSADGTLDRDFGLDGQVVTQVGGGDDEITGLTIDRQGRILVVGSAAGTSGRVVVLARYLDNGSLDTSFGSGGMTLTGIGTDAIAQGIALADDGRIVVSGSYSDGERTGVMVAGFTADGKPDTGFGTDSVGVAEAKQMISEGYGLLLRDDGSILVAGSVGQEGQRDAALFAFTADGRPDPGFGDNGVLVSPAGPEDDVLYAIGTDGRTIRASGYATSDGRRSFLLLSWSPETIRPSASTPPAEPAAGTSMSTTLHIGKLQVAGSLAASSLLAAEEPAAAPVPRLITTGFDTDNAVSYALAIQADGKVVTAGAGSDPGGTDSVAVARYSGETDSTTGPVTASFNGTVITRSISQVTRTGAVVTSEIVTGESIVERGVVFSTIPYPDLENTTPDNPDTPPGDVLTVTITSPASGESLPAGTTQTGLVVTTDANATCSYSLSSDSGAGGTVQNDLASSDGREHTATLTGLEEGAGYTVNVSCSATDSEAAGNAGVTFSVQSATRMLTRTMKSIGNFLVPDAQAVTTTIADTTVTDQTGTVTATPDLFSAMDDNFVTSGSTSDGSGTGIFSSVLENLRPGTFFYVRAYARTASGTVYYGNQQGFRTADSCFIATAAFGSIFHPYVRILRNFRDAYLLGNGPGRQMVSLYYRYSPRLADRIAAVPALRAITRILLLPVVGAAWIALQAGLTGLLLAGAILLAAWWCIRPPELLLRSGRQP